MRALKILRAALLQTHVAPKDPKTFELEYEEDAALVIAVEGSILDKGPADRILRDWPQLPVDDARPLLMVPGFIDTHIHFPQMDMVGACAPSLLPWLNTYTFPEEQRFRGSPLQMREQAEAFARELLSQGTTLAVIYSSSSYAVTQSLFEAFERTGLRGIIGKVSMDRHAPEGLLVGAAQDLRETEQLLADWHGKDGRLHVALTPRFAPNCSPELMRGLSDIARRDPSVYIQTHFAENLDEIDWVKQLFPAALDYLDVYESFGLLQARTILAHCIHVSSRERSRLKDLEIVLSHCPTSNLFLGSGLMPFRQYEDQGLRLSLGTDVGAGTSFSLWQTINEGYKVAQLRGEPVTCAELFYAATLGAAKALSLPWLGSLEVSYEADLQLLDVAMKPMLHRRWLQCRSHEERLNALVFGADDRLVKRVIVRGRDLK